ncbi:hypothetical protein Phum_PHUM427220 [Pediculus humanus corporis]|uniref:Uncharacterized protein n=1 Tax=Pediculus humanus subsp. corporis TaxID=121224 RepID=E0VT61_PEDHC|nr:uncharacterized protein Phum_PHUM427220 [Pediculus humanus corporis]EEB16567.1 hypothetical protein Phum_PHUM427220 [Pediculus humanus corporis]
MSKRYSFVISVASICGLVRPKCPLDGNYLGKFNNDYKNGEKINLMTPDIIFAILVAKIMFNISHVILSIFLYKANNKEIIGNKKRLTDLLMGWTLLTLSMSCLDGFLTFQLFQDMFSLINYLDSDNDFIENPLLGGIQFIPLIFGLVSCRLIVLWFWNVIGKKESLNKSKNEENESYSPMPIRKISNGLPYRKTKSEWDLYTMEAVTHFNEDESTIPKTFLPNEKVEEVEEQTRKKNDYIFAYSQPEIDYKNGIKNDGYDYDTDEEERQVDDDDDGEVEKGF